MTIDLKVATPDGSVPLTGFIIGADSQSAAEPSVYTIDGVRSAIHGKPMSISYSMSGALSGEYYLNSIIVPSDSATNTTGNTYGFYVKWVGSDSTKLGGRFAFGALADVMTAGDPADVAGSNFYCGGILQAIARYDNTSTGAVAKPAVYGGNSNVVALATAANWGNIIGHEVDVVTYAGATYESRNGLDIVLAGTGPQGTVRDNGLGFKATPGITGWKHLFVFDNLSGASPLASTGTVIGSVGSMTIANGVDFSSCTITGKFLKSTGFDVNGSGAVTGASFTTTGEVSAGSTSVGGSNVIYNASAPANSKYWDQTVGAAGGSLFFRALDDALSPTTFLTITRSAGVATTATFAVPALLPASTASLPSLRLPHGSAPSSPTNGDVWTTTSAMYVRINGVTYEVTTGAPSTYAKSRNVVVFTSSGTYTPTAGMKTVDVICYGGGGGGGGGGRAAAGVAISGGGGGGGGGRAIGSFTATQIGASQTVTIGAAGAAGAAAAADSTNGNAGTGGGYTALGNLLLARGGGGGAGGQIGTASGGGGAGGVSTQGTDGTGAAGGIGSWSVGNGGYGSAGVTNLTVNGNGSGGGGSPASGAAGNIGGTVEKVGSSGGGSGGGISAADATSNGAYGGQVYVGGTLYRAQYGTAGGTVNGSAGSTWANSATGPLDQAAGGGGGGASDATAAGSGGAGGLTGGGGGGGGSARNGGAAGAGGAGGAGLMIIIENF